MTAALEQAAGRAVSRETMALLTRYAELLKAANRDQNLIAASTVATLWERHIHDSAQLVQFEPGPGASWIDIGSGAGLPGFVIAALVQGPIALIEPRRLRAAFLETAVSKLGLADRVSVHCAKVESVEGHYDVVTARAVAPLGRLLGMARHLAHRRTIWVLPKGRNAKSELAEAQRSWQCEARVEASRTDPQASILVLSNVRAKSKR